MREMQHRRATGTRIAPPTPAVRAEEPPPDLGDDGLEAEEGDVIEDVGDGTRTVNRCHCTGMRAERALPELPDEPPEGWCDV